MTTTIEALCKVANRRSIRRVRGFTLVELLSVIGVIAVLAALAFGVLTRGRATARRAQCDIQLKTLALALDTFKQERGYYPKRLNDLQSGKFLQDSNVLRCPDDPRPAGLYDPTSSAQAPGSYEEFYAVRSPRDGNSVPLIVCPLHEKHGGGAQAYKGRYTKQWSAAAAQLTSINNVSIERPDGKGPLDATSGLALHGGDRLRVGGSATIQFADGTTCNLQAGSDVTVLQSFVEGSAPAPLYTIVRQTRGRVEYTIHHGSKFDVVMPTATAGARGTKFYCDVAADGKSKVFVTEGKVFISTRTKSGLARIGQEVSLVGDLIGGGFDILDGLGGLLGGLL